MKITKNLNVRLNEEQRNLLAEIYSRQEIKDVDKYTIQASIIDRGLKSLLAKLNGTGE